MLSNPHNAVFPLEGTNPVNSLNTASVDLLSPVQSRLQAIASSDELFSRVLGEKANSTEIQGIRAQWLAGDFSVFPRVQVLDVNDMGGAFGAYSQSTQTIYLSNKLVHSAQESVDPIFGATGVLVEETFHWLDSLVGEDTPGDEGELARHLIFGVTPSAEELTRIAREQDQGFIIVNGQAIAVELSGDGAGNSFGTARFSTPSTTTTTFRDWVGDNIDGVDFYQFTLTQESQVWFHLHSLTGGANLGLLNQQGQWVTWASWDGSSSNKSIWHTLTAGTYYVGVYSASGSAYYNLNASATAIRPTVTIEATDAEAAETAIGQPRNPGRFTLTRTGSTASALTVNYTIGGTATNGTDYGNLTGSVTFAAGSNTAFVDINPIDDSGFEGSETVVLTLANSSVYQIGTSNRATVTIADNDLPTVTIAATDANAAETAIGQPRNPGRFTLTRTGSTASALTVNYTIGGTATNRTDYGNLTGSVTFAAGSNTAFIDINPIDDSGFEGSETVVLTLANSSVYQIGTSNRATVTIADNDLPTVTIAATDTNAAETAIGQPRNPGRFTLTRTGSTASALTVNYTIGGTATNGTDYGNLTGSVTFAAGSNTAFIDINPIDDSGFEGSETVVLTLANSSVYQIGTSNRATVTIADNDLPTVTIAATDTNAAETAIGQPRNPGRFTLTRTGSTASALTVNYTIGGTATNGTDYGNLTGSVTFAAGSNTAFVDINPIDDSGFEGSETVVLTLANSSVYQIGTSNRATVTIADNDLPTVTIAATDTNAAETAIGQPRNPGRFTLTRTGSTASALTVNYTIGGTATNGTDYGNLTGSVTFAAGSNTAFIDINPIDDSGFEGSETVVLTLANSSVYQIGTSNRATVTIADNDLPTVTIAATDANAAETAIGQPRNPGRFTLTRTGSTASALTVNYTIGGTATNGTDYGNLTGSVTFAAGSNTAFIDINPIDDSGFEGSETVVLTLANSSVYQIGTSNRATVTIADNDWDDAGNSMSSARQLQLSFGESNALSITDWLGQSDSNDYYRFDLSQASAVQFRLTGLSLNVDLELFDRNQQRVGLFNRGGTADEAIGWYLQAGQYYLRAFTPNTESTHTSYTLRAWALNVGNTASIGVGKLGADTFQFNPLSASTSQSVFIGNGNIDFGRGWYDELDLSSTFSHNARFNWAGLSSGGAIFNPGNGNRVFDQVTVNGFNVLFEGIERVRFADRVMNVWEIFNTMRPNDPDFGQQWNLHMIGVHHAWRFTTGNNNVLIGVQDDGIGVNSSGQIHPDLRSGDVASWISNNYQYDFENPDQNGVFRSHGTPVQSIIAAASNNGIGMSGINWHSPVFHIDVIGRHTNDLSLKRATEEMIARRQDRKLVINMSLGTLHLDGSPSFGEYISGPAFENLVRNNPNVLFVIAAGNHGQKGREGISSPAVLARHYSNVIAVGAVWGTKDAMGQTRVPGTRIEYPDSPDSKGWGSQYGDGLTLMAPSEVTSATSNRNGTYGEVSHDYSDKFNGTSAAAPHVAGVASLLWSLNPNLTGAQIKNILSQTAVDMGTPGWDKYYGHGVVNADAAVRRAMALARGVA